MDDNELFENKCLPLAWLEDEDRFEAPPVKKDLQTLLSELEDIKERIDELSAKEWYLAKLIRFHKEGFTTTH